MRVLTERLPTYVRGRKALLSRLQRHVAQGGLVVLTGGGGMGNPPWRGNWSAKCDRALGEDAKPVWEVSAADLSSLTGGLITVAAGLGATESDLQAISIRHLRAPTVSGGFSSRHRRLAADYRQCGPARATGRSRRAGGEKRAEIA